MLIEIEMFGKKKEIIQEGPKPIIQFKGSNGTISLFENFVRISRNGFMAFSTYGLKGDKDIYFTKISSIQLKKPGTITEGYIQFTLSGGNESRGGYFDAAKDENTVMFQPKNLGLALDIKQFIEDKLFNFQNQPIQTIQKDDSIEQIEKFYGLMEKGIISKEEFEAKKKQILGL